MKLKIKKILCIALILLVTICVLSAMAKNGPSKSSAKTSSAVSIVTTIFPIYDWTREIAGDANVEITMLIDKGVDLHSYQPTFQDIARISKCDVFLYVGGESELWVADALKEAKNQNMRTVDMMSAIGERALEEEEKEGMEEEHEHAHEHEDDEEEEYDEHLWLSLKNARILTNAICSVLCSADPSNATKYKANTSAYNTKLAALDSKYEAATKSAKIKTLVFADRFPFLYMADDYGLDYFAAFKGCSAESEASFKTVMFLANKIDELNVSKVLTIETSDGKLAKTVIKNSKDKNREILVLNSMQSLGARDAKKGANYLDIMEKNLEVLKQALN